MYLFSGMTSLSDDGCRLIVARPSYFELHNLANRKTPGFITNHYNVAESCAVFAHNGMSFVGVYDPGRARMWSTDEGGLKKMFTVKHSSTSVPSTVTGLWDQNLCLL